MTAGGERKNLYILGIGLNVNSDMRRDSDLCGLATSTWCETGRRIPREEMLVAMCGKLSVYLNKSRSELLAMYGEHAVFSEGSNVKVYLTGASGPPYIAWFCGVDNNWTALLKSKLSFLL